MKRFLISIFIFTLLFTLSYPVYLFIFGSIPVIQLPNLAYKLGGYGHLHSRLHEIDKFKDVDILFLGSSHAYRGFDVRIFEKSGFKTFNLGSSAQTPIQTQLLLDRYLNSLNPKLVIYAISPSSFSSDGVESAVDIISNSKNDILSMNMALKINHPKVYNTLIYGFMRDIFKLNSNFNQPVQEKATGYIDTYISGGYVEKSTNIHFNANATEEKYPESEIIFLHYQLNAFKEIISYFKTRNIEYILVRTPVANYNISKNNDEFNNVMQQYGQYIDFNKIFNFTDNYYYDAGHLKQEGAEIFSARVSDLVGSLNIK